MVALARRQRLEPAHQVGLEPPGNGAAAPREDGRTRPVGRQVEHRGRAGELPLPVLPEPLALGAGQQLGLPADEVAVLLGRSRQRRGPAGALGRVERLHLLDHQDQRPEIADDVVDTQQEDVIVRGAPEEVHAHERPALQVKRAVGLFLQPLAQRLLAPRRRIDHLERQRRLLVDALQQNAVALLERRPQAGVAIDQLLHGTAERRQVERRADPRRIADVIRRAPGVHLVEEPQPALAVGEREDRGGLLGLFLEQLRQQPALLGERQARQRFAARSS